MENLLILRLKVILIQILGNTVLINLYGGTYMTLGVNILIITGLIFAYVSYILQNTHPIMGVFFALLGAYLLFYAARRLTKERKGNSRKNT